MSGFDFPFDSAFEDDVASSSTGTPTDGAIDTTITLRGGDSLWIFLETSDALHHFVVYDPVLGFRPEYAEQSSKTLVSGTTYHVVVSPFAGWPPGQHTLHFVSGTELSVPDLDFTDRWQPMTASLTLGVGDELFIFWRTEDVSLCVHDTDLSPLFDNPSTVISDVHVNPVTVALMPNGGWQGDFFLKYVTGVEV